MAFVAVCALLTFLGVIGFIIGVASGAAQRAIEAYLVNLLFFAGVAQGGVVASAAFYLTQGRWGGPGVFRLAETFYMFIPVAFVLFWMLFFWRAELWPWIAHPALAKQPKWLNTPFFFAREGAAFLSMALLSIYFVGVSQRQDSRQWTLRNDDITMPPQQIRRVAPVLGIAFVAIYTMIAFDLVMSLAPDWKSSLFGWFFLAGAFWSAIVWMALLAVILGEVLPARNLFTQRKVLHDLGKMIFAFSVFWAYLVFAQYIVIWYGDLPHETFWLVTRGAIIGGAPGYTPWRWMTWAAPILIWALPFTVLMGAEPKKTPLILGAVAALGICGMWIERYVLIVPSISPHRIPFDWIELLVTLGFLGLFGLSAIPGLRVTIASAIAPQVLEGSRK